ncbi:hypothetical protein MRX96_006673 [Rhipicephalus microplus]
MRRGTEYDRRAPTELDGISCKNAIATETDATGVPTAGKRLAQLIPEPFFANEDKASSVRQVEAPRTHNAIGERPCAAADAHSRGARVGGLAGLYRAFDPRADKACPAVMPVTTASRKGSRPFIIRHVMHAAPKRGASQNCFVENRVPRDTR